MNISEYLQVIDACRFCFMCRHLSPVGNVTFKEADTPRGRALLLDKVRMDSSNLSNTDYIETLYEAELSAACRYHCVSGYDEAGLVLAARRDVVELGSAPENIQKIASELRQAEFTVEGSGDVLYYRDPYTEKYHPEIAGAFLALAGNCKIASGGDCGKALEVLGFTEDAAAVTDSFGEITAESDCSTVVVSCPAAYDRLKKNLSVPGVEVLHSSEYLLSAMTWSAAGISEACYLESDYLKNYNGNLQAPRELLEASGYSLMMFGANNEESYTAGEGAVIYDRICPNITEKLSKRVREAAAESGGLTLITASPYTKYALNKFTPSLKVITVEEAVLLKKEEAPKRTVALGK